MGDLQDCSRRLNAVVAAEDSLFAVSIGEETWATAEKTTQEVLRCIHPTLDSEEKRKDVIEYVQGLIRYSLQCEVFPYGSVPLKTYLPDGDIDLTALISPAVEETLAQDVYAVLQAEEYNENAEYEVKDTQFIDAEVKLVKCLVQDIVVDISFNKLGGLSSLCFLEQVDRLVGKDHLFKRSIILVKAWCYYESRILGGHYGLISTYALETLVLYIFHLFHTSLNGPLAVLYRFLDYFSNFDWENYCISLKGPVRKSSLPNVIVDMAADVGNNLLFTEEFIRNCVEMFSIPSRGKETDSRAFPQKHLNIIDPLKENNNLGRSVHRGNFYRICSAFKYGARKLSRILILPRERIADEIKSFFTSTLDRHGREQSSCLSLSSHSRMSSEEKCQWSLMNFYNNIPSTGDNELNIDRIGISGLHIAGQADLRINNSSDCSLSSGDLSESLSEFESYTPDLYYSGSSTENGKLENSILHKEWPRNVVDMKMILNSWMEHVENDSGTRNGVGSCNNHDLSSCGSGIMNPDACRKEGLAFDDFRESDVAGSPETSNPLSDLSGDYESHIRSLLYGHALSTPAQPNAPTFPSQFQIRKPRGNVRRSMLPKHNARSQMRKNGVTPVPTYKPVSNLTQHNFAMGLEDKHILQRTGSYFPILNGCLCRDPLLLVKGRNQARRNHQQFWRSRPCKNESSFALALAKEKSFEGLWEHPQKLHGHARNEESSLASTLPEEQPFEGTLEVPHAWRLLPCHKNSVASQSTRSTFNNPNDAGFSISYPDLEFGSLGPFSKETNLTVLDPYLNQGVPTLASVIVQSSVEASRDSQERVGKQPYILKNEDFPPLAM